MIRIFVLVFLFSFSIPSFAADCLQISGNYKVQVAENLIHLKVDQQGCDRFDFIYTYSNNRIEQKIYLPDSVERAVSDDGDYKISEKSQLKEIVVGDKYKTSALWVRSEVFSRIEEKKYISESYFYPEFFRNGKALIERREVYDENGEKLRTVYFGMVEDK